MSDPYLSHAETVFRSMIAASEVGRFEVRASEREAARSLDLRVMGQVLVRWPDLCPNGFATRDLNITGAAFGAYQDKMLQRSFLGQFNRALAFMTMCCGRRKTINSRVTSYGLKHAAERAIEGLGVAEVYVSNGALIAAAIALGYRVKRIPGTPNAFFNIEQVEGK